MQVTAPTTSSTTTISASVRVTDNGGILASGVTVDATTTVTTNNFVCTQVSWREVTCTVDVTAASAGSLVIRGVDQTGLAALGNLSPITISTSSG